MADILNIAIYITYVIFILSLIFSLLRLAKGPTLADRVVALDLIAFLTIGVIVIYTMDTGVIDYLDIAVTLALVGFFSTVAFTKYIMREKGKK